MQLLIVNSAEPDVTEFAENIAKIVQGEQVNYDLINYRDCQKQDLSKYEGILISGSPQGDDIVEHHQPFFNGLNPTKNRSWESVPATISPDSCTDLTTSEARSPNQAIAKLKSSRMTPFLQELEKPSLRARCIMIR